VQLPDLDPEIRAILETFPPGGEYTTHTLDDRRAEFDAKIVAATSDKVERTDHEIRPGGPIVRVSRPRDIDDSLPCLFWMHGGGLVLGSRLQDDRRFDVWCERHGIVAVSVEYRLAPETKFPGPLDDCYDGLLWVAEHCDTLGIDRDRIGVGGASAGGGLAAALALLARDRGTVALAFQLLIYPMLDDRQVTRSSQMDMPIWPPAATSFGWHCYLGAAAATDSIPPYAAPARAKDLGRLPPAYITVGTADGFVDECIDYGTRLLHAGVTTDLRVHAGLPHGYDIVAPQAKATKAAQRDLNQWLSRLAKPLSP